jgi:lipopolysaccharide transport system ATP-binding protein
MQGEHLFTTSERDAALNYDRFMVKKPGRYLSRCRVPANLLNRGSFVVGISAAIPNVHVLFWEPSAVQFAVDDAGGPGSQWAGDRGGFFRPALHWDVLAS